MQRKYDLIAQQLIDIANEYLQADPSRPPDDVFSEFAPALTPEERDEENFRHLKIKSATILGLLGQDCEVAQ